jgi:hypothetical protein
MARGAGALGDDDWVGRGGGSAQLSGQQSVRIGRQLSVDDVRKQEQVYVTSGSITTMNTKMTTISMWLCRSFSIIILSRAAPSTLMWALVVGFGLPASFLCQPRVGVELYRHHRIALSSHIGFGHQTVICGASG